MSQTTDPRVRWTTTDLNLLPDSSNRYEIIDGELLVTKAPHWGHQKAIINTVAELRNWSLATQLGETVPTPGIIFGDTDNVIPDAVWISKERLATSLDEAGHLTVASRLAAQTSRGLSSPDRNSPTGMHTVSRRSLNFTAVTQLHLRR